MSKTDRHLSRQKVCQRISVMKTNTGVFVVFETNPELKCKLSGNIECVCFHYWDSWQAFWRDNWQSIIDVVKRLDFRNTFCLLWWKETKKSRNH